MKVNLKKMGAIVAGATILASSVGFAALMFGDTTLVDDNGAPLAKVVLGTEGTSSDGVAGGLIAGKFVSEAHAEQELTAAVVGEPTCTETDGEEAGTGTCEVTDEKVKLQITVPGGAVEGTYTVNNLIGDYLNRRMLDRVDNVPDTDPDYTDAAYPLGGSDVSENANPFTDGSASGSLGPTEEYLLRIDGNMFSPFATQNINDDEAGRAYREEQALWLRGSSYYDESPEEVVGDLRFLAYTLKFWGSGDDYGVPVCTTPEGSDYAYCKLDPAGDLDYATESHKVNVGFLGEPWIISEMNPPVSDMYSGGSSSNNLITETDLREGGMVKLAKESISGVINQGESLPVDDLKFQLDDLEAHGGITAAIISVVDANGNVLKKDKVGQMQTKEFSIQGKLYRFHVYKVAPGYTFGAKWADVAIYSKELELESGQHLDPDYDANEFYEVVLGWKNKGADASDPQPDHLRVIGIFGDDVASLSSGGEEQMEVGDSVPIVQDPVAWTLTYQGLDITNSERTYLRFDLERSNDKTISASHGPVTTSGNGTRVECTIWAPYIKVKSGGTGTVFELPGASTGFAAGDVTLSGTEFYIASANYETGVVPPVPNPALVQVGYGATCEAEGGTAWPVECTNSENPWLDDGECPAGTVFMPLSPSSTDYGLKAMNDNTYCQGAGWPFFFDSIVVEYNSVGDGDTTWERGGVLELAQYGSATVGAHTGGYGCTYMGDLRDQLAAINPFPGGDGCYAEDLTARYEPRCYGDSRLFHDFWWNYGMNAQGTDGYIAISEKAGEDTSNDFANYHLFGYDENVGDSTFDFDTTVEGGPGYTTDGLWITREDHELYMYAGPVEDRGTVQSVEEPYISERGSVFDEIEDTSVRYYMADDVAHSQWYLASVEQAEAEAGSVIRTLAEGEETTVSGVTVKVLEITETVLPCTVGTAATPACVADTSGVSAVISPQGTETVTAAIPYDYTNYGNLVILDKDAVGVNTLVSVGGDKVNTVTKELLGGSVDWTTTKKVVREVVQGSKIVVAGAEAEDTLEAAQDFVSQLRKV
jgi:hypothetical protein